MKRNYLNYIAIIISLSTLFLFWFRLEPITAEWMGVLVGILSLLVTVLIGWNIYVLIDFKKNINDAEQKHNYLVHHTETSLLIMYKANADIAYEKNNLFGLINNSIFAIGIAIQLGNIKLGESLLKRVLEATPEKVYMSSFYKSMLATAFYSVKNWKLVNGYIELEKIVLNIIVNEDSNTSQLDYF